MMKQVMLFLLLGAGCSSPSSASNPPSRATAPEPVETAEPAKPDPNRVNDDLFAAETAAYGKARPAFETYCASCHTKSGKRATNKKLGHFDMTAYPFGGEHAKSIGNEIRGVLAIDGAKPPSMPEGKPGSVKPADLAAIKAWTEAWQAAGAAGVHPAQPAVRDDD